MEIEQGLLELPNDTHNANTVKLVVLEKLLYDGIITQEQFENYSLKHQIIVTNKNWFQKWRDKFFTNSKSDWFYKYVKFEE